MIKASESKIKAVIFDLGGVLVDFHPVEGMEKMGFSKEAVEVFREKIFSGLWEYCDRIPYELEEIKTMFKEAVPGYEKEVDILWDKLHSITGVRPYSNEWLINLKEKGYKIYVLSNFGKKSFEINSQIYDFLQYVDGRVVSYEVEKIKPEREIFDALRDKYDINPAEAVFIDDRKLNVDASIEYGYHGIVFESYEQALAQLESITSER